MSDSIPSKTGVATVFHTGCPIAPDGWQSVEKEWVDADEYRSLRARHDELQRQLYLLQNERDNLADNVDRLQSETSPANSLRLVAEAARNLVAGARDIDMVHAKVDEASLVALETALAAGGYDSE